MRQLLRLQAQLKQLTRASSQMHSGPRSVAAAAAAGGQQSQLAMSAVSRPAALLPAAPRPVQQALCSFHTLHQGSRGYASSAAAATQAVSSRRKTSPPQAYGAEQIQVTAGMHACTHQHKPSTSTHDWLHHSYAQNPFLPLSGARHLCAHSIALVGARASTCSPTIRTHMRMHA